MPSYSGASDPSAPKEQTTFESLLGQLDYQIDRLASNNVDIANTIDRLSPTPVAIGKEAMEDTRPYGLLDRLSVIVERFTSLNNTQQGYNNTLNRIV